MEPLRLLDGAIGTALLAKGFPSHAAWTASAALTHPELLAQVHRDYASAGATLHTANTFRTRPADLPMQWRDALARSVDIARSSVSPEHQVLGSLAPHDDCYHPCTPATHTADDHRRVASALAAAGVDLILCETFARGDEALIAVDAALGTGLPVWLALTPLPDLSGLTPGALADIAEQAVERGAARVLVNCGDARGMQPYIERIAHLPCGVYANAGPLDGDLGWGAAGGAARYADLAFAWRRAGAGIIGGCCGTGPQHLAALHTRLFGRDSRLPEDA